MPTLTLNFVLKVNCFSPFLLKKWNGHQCLVPGTFRFQSLSRFLTYIPCSLVFIKITLYKTFAFAEHSSRCQAGSLPPPSTATPAHAALGGDLAGARPGPSGEEAKCAQRELQSSRRQRRPGRWNSERLAGEPRGRLALRLPAASGAASLEALRLSAAVFTNQPLPPTPAPAGLRGAPGFA